jgi:hypothetical protein
MKLVVAILLTCMLASAGQQILLIAGAALGCISAFWLVLDRTENFVRWLFSRSHIEYQ